MKKWRRHFVVSIMALCMYSYPDARAQSDDRASMKVAPLIAIPDENQHHQEKENKQDDICQFWGNSFSLKFHLKSCPFAQAMNPRHVQFLKNINDAFELGEKPCRYCLPPYTLSVSCKILAAPTAVNQADNSDVSEVKLDDKETSNFSREAAQ